MKLNGRYLSRKDASIPAAGDSISMHQERVREPTEAGCGQSAYIHLPFRLAVLTIRPNSEHLATPPIDVDPCQELKHKRGRSLLISNLP
ncbi:MAG TPA: hypothetical protein VMB75_00780, partial [Rhodocyclaceae bacterium]|nr:hypothetical protein [Rhodocyclaceae bacterium]